MRVLVQRSLESNVKVDGKVVGKINNGLVLLVGFTGGDTLEDIAYLAKRVVNLRIFDDENKVMNKSLLDVQGEILSISQFTLYADTKTGGFMNRTILVPIDISDSELTQRVISHVEAEA